jgi:hypothetical protein
MGACSSGIDEEDAKVIDSIFRLSSLTDLITVDRSRLQDSCEAWIYVVLPAQREKIYLSAFSGFGESSTPSGR